MLYDELVLYTIFVRLYSNNMLIGSLAITQWPNKYLLLTQILEVFSFLPDISSSDCKVCSTVIKAQRFNLKRSLQFYAKSISCEL